MLDIMIINNYSYYFSNELFTYHCDSPNWAQLSYAPTCLFSSFGKGQTPSLPLIPLSFLNPSSPFGSRPPKIQLGGLWDRWKLPKWGLEPSRQTIWCILSQKRAALMAAFFVDFPMNKCTFLHKNKLDAVRRYHLFRGERFPGHQISWVSDWLSTRYFPWDSSATEVVTETKFGTRIA